MPRVSDKRDSTIEASKKPGNRAAPLRFELVSSAFRVVRSLPDRLLYSRRRADARRLVGARAPIRSILVVCYGNICRSPFAAALLARGVPNNGLDRTVTSAGFVGPGRQPPKHALAVSLARNIDLGSHRSQLVTSTAVKAAELIVVMSADQAILIRQRFAPVGGAILVLGDLDPKPITARTIRDPWGQDLSVFEESYARIERCIVELERLLSGDVSD
jgi:protein-tyrosine-phosphatase